MKNPKKKNSLIVGCVALSILLALGSYMTLVIVGVIAEDNKNNGNYVVQDENVYDTNVNTENGYTDGNGYVSGDGYVNNNVYVPDNSVVNPGVNNTVTGSANGNFSNNTVPGISDLQNIQNSLDSLNTQQSNPLLDKNKTAADIVEIYATLMNKAKAEKPGFTKVEYQELPGGPENRVISQGEENVSEEAINKLFGFIEQLGVFVPKEKAESNPYVHEKGDADMSLFPVFSREKGSYLTDPKSIESYTYDILSNGNVKMRFVLVPENNPEPIAENASVAPSYTGAVFSPMSKARIDRTVTNPIITIFAKNIQYTLRYHDCYVEVEFDPDTMQIVNLKQFANVSIKGSGDVVAIGTIGLERQELLSTVIIKDFQW